MKNEQPGNKKQAKDIPKRIKLEFVVFGINVRLNSA